MDIVDKILISVLVILTLCAVAVTIVGILAIIGVIPNA